MPAGQKMLLAVLILLVCTPDLSAHGHNPASPEVVTKHGRLRGQQIYIGEAERNVSVFLGVPFAKPPIGPLRFSPPEPPEPWSSLRNATSYPPMCLQDRATGQQLSDDFTNRKEKLSWTMSENCLYLNIYTPATSDMKEKLPVMVWIHGGGLAVGAASTYDGSALAAFENVIVITLQYRLNIFGFFSTGDEFARGNWGLLDQVAALRWIQENIADFGGDPKSVTIFGESSGGSSVSLLVLSPLANGLFHKAISESGVAFIEPSTFHPAETAKKTAALAGCDPAVTTAEMVHCLREKTGEEILNVTLKLSIIMMPPVVDGVFLPKSGLELYTAKEINEVPYMIGVNNHEFGRLLPILLKFPDLTEGLDKEMVISVIKAMKHMTGVPPEHVHILEEEYLVGTEDPSQLRDQLADLLGDCMFVVPSIKIAKLHRDAGYPVYFYEFQHQPSAYAGVRPDYVRSDHGDEIGFVFGKPFLAGDATEEEQHLSRKVMSYWANFARTGDPNSEGLVTWPAYDQNEQYLEIDLKQKAAQRLKEKRVIFWTKVLPQKLAESKRKGSEL
ncbi:fatty acyl-CoA hydrolase precursor, medium chain-like [Tiliqua scincoides]|uniref:fatty acyl-CoA hydrolase precursor, medium chain-like n=1 Tax=Tiliqua scincoides TaxID=71010 RepID=UPI0034625F7D